MTAPIRLEDCGCRTDLATGKVVAWCEAHVARLADILLDGDRVVWRPWPSDPFDLGPF